MSRHNDPEIRREIAERADLPLFAEQSFTKFEQAKSGLSSTPSLAAHCENGGCPDVGAGVLPPSVKGSPRNEVYLLASEIVDVVEFAEQYRQEELEAEREGMEIAISGYPDPAHDPRFA